MFRHLTIRKRLALVLWGTALLAFAAAGAALALYQSLTLERRVRRIMEPYAQFIAVGADAAVAFEDPGRAQEILDSLRANPEILEAVIILEDGRTLARYGAPGVEIRPHPRSTDGVYFAPDEAELLQRLKQGARLHLTMSLDQITRQAQKTLWIFGAGALVFLAITLGQMTVLQRTLVRPVATLSEAVEHIRARADYSHRVPAEGDDEIARLGQGFNAMMDAIRQRDEALREKSAELDRYFTSALDLLCIADTDGRFRRLNPAWENTLGYTVTELEGRRFLDFVHPDDREATLREVGRLREQKEVLGFTNRYRHKNGSYRWIEWRSFPSGKLIYAVARDITERNRAEEALRESEERFRALVETSQDWIWAINLEGVHTFSNPAFEQILGFGFEELREHELGLLHEEDRELVRSKWPRWVERRKGWTHLLLRWRHKQGGYRYLDSNAAPSFDANGQLTGFRGVDRDVTEQMQAAAALRESEERFRALVETSPDWVWGMDEHGVYTYASPRSKDLLGYDPNDIIGRTPFDFMPAEEAERVRAEFDRIFRTRRPFARLENVNRHKDGRLVVLETSGVPIIDTRGIFRGYRGVDRDITERKRAEQALRESLSLLQATLESTADGILVVNEAGRIASHNQQFVALWHMPGEVLATKDDETALRFMLQQLKEPEAFLARVKELYAQPEADSFDLLEFIDGRLVERYSRPQLVEGRPVGRVWSFRDVTARRRAESDLQESERRFRTLFENMTEAVALHEMIYDRNGQPTDYRILDANPAYGRHTGLAPEKVCGRLASEVYGAGSAPHLKEWAEVARTGKPHVLETFFSPMERHFHISAVSPRPGFFATVFEDITDRKRNEEELQLKNEELERFTYTVSHDLKSPLITIKAFAGALQQDVAAGRRERLEGDLKRIADATDRMTELLNDLLELSRIGRIINPPSNFALGDLVREVIELLAGLVRQSGVEITVQRDLPWVRGDRSRLIEVFQNLIENSIRFMGKQPRPMIEIGMREQERRRVFFVRDNGIGIEPRYHETVFGLFNKLDARTAGTGLGLALVRRILEVHGGKIWVESEGHGRGSTFCFTLPSTPTTRKEKRS
jgi:PAS domain S-box-containing protein